VQINEKVINEKSEKLINYVGLKEVENNYCADLSGGEEQRVAIARALINDADIILADEPVASLDNENTENILNLLSKLAHELNKIVIIVSHDNYVANQADVLYEIKDCKIIKSNQISNIPIKKVKEENRNEIYDNKNKLIRFIRFYSKNRKVDKKQEIVMLIILALVAAICTLFFNFGEGFYKSQNNFVEAISDKNIFVVNDTLGLNGKSSYDESLSISKEEIDKIKDINIIDKVYPFYEFKSKGFCDDRDSKAEISVYDGENCLKKIVYENLESKGSSVSNEESKQFSVQPIYKEENLNLLIDNGKYDGSGVILTNAMAKLLDEDVNNLIGKNIEIQCFVPTKLYDSIATKPTDGSKVNNVRDAQEIKVDFSIVKLVKISEKIVGILSTDYSNQRSSNDKTIILMNEVSLDKIIKDNKDTNYKETYPGFPEKELGPSSLVTYSTTYDLVEATKEKIQDINPNFVVTSKASDVKAIKENLESIKSIMNVVTAILTGIVILMFGFTYYLKNKTRKKEIGILKAIGMKSKEVLYLICYEMLIVAIKTFVIAITLTYGIKIICSYVLSMGDIVTITFGSVIFCFIFTLTIITLASLFSIFKTSRIDPVDAIRMN